MKVGILGSPQSGKTTLFQALTRGKVPVQPMGSARPNVGVVSVPDERVDYFAAQYKPKKVTYAPIEFTDVAPRPGAQKEFDAAFFADVRKSDAIVAVIRGFVNEYGEEPSPADRRHKLFSLTPKGAQYNTIMQELSAELLERFYKGFTAEEVELFGEFLEKIVKNFE